MGVHQGKMGIKGVQVEKSIFFLRLMGKDRKKRI